MSDYNDFDIRDGVLVKYRGRAAATVDIPYGVVKIGDYAFKDCLIFGVNIPDSVRIIGEGAFEGNNITKLDIPQSVYSIGPYAFAENYILKDVYIAGEVADLPQGIFKNCMSLGSVTLPEGLLTIGEIAFVGCIQLYELSLPDSVQEIYDYAFYGCAISSIDIPNGIQLICNGAFEQSELHKIYYFGTKKQWAALLKGVDWNRGLLLNVICSNGIVKADNMPKIKDFKKSNMRVKVTTVTSWSKILDLRILESNYVWQANYALTKRKIRHILFSLFLFALMSLSFVRAFVPEFGAFVVVGPAVTDIELTEPPINVAHLDILAAIFSPEFALIFAECLILPCIICFIKMRSWRKLLGGYKYYCGQRGYLVAKGFTKFLFYFCYVISTVFSILVLLLFFTIIMALCYIAPSAGGLVGLFSFNDKLGIPKNTGNDEVIEAGEKYDYARYTAFSENLSAILDDIDYRISIKCDYNEIKGQLDKVDADIAQLEQNNNGLSYEDEQKLNELKRKSKEKRDKLEASYQAAIDDFYNGYNSY